MKHRGDNAPKNFSVEAQPNKPGYVLARFYENVEPFSETVGEATMSGYRYDEYHLELADYDGIAADIGANLSTYLRQAKAQEEADEATDAKISRAMGTLSAASNAALLALADADMIDGSLPGVSDALISAREKLTGLPVWGAAWDASKRYITGDTVAVDGENYIALRYSKGKLPASSPHYWQPAPVAPVRQAWVDITDGTVISVGVIVTHEGAAWKCTTQHIKSTVYRPKAGSSKWTVA